MKKIYLLLTVIILTLSCQKEEFVEEIIVVENSQIQKNTVSKQEILGNPELMYALNAAKNKISTTRKNMKSGTSFSGSDLNVDLENGVRLTKESYTSYTFPVVRENRYIENLLVSLQENGTYRTMLISYSISEFERKALKNDEYIDLSKKAEITLLEGIFPINKSWNKSAETCYNIDVNTVVETCDWTGNHTYEEILAGADCNDPTPPSAPVYYISFTPDNCDSESSGGEEEPDPTPLNPGGDPITTDPDPEPGGDLTTPLLPTDEYLLERFFTSLSNDQKSWIFDGNLPWINNEIVPFLKANNFSAESKLFAKEGLNAKIAGGEVDFEEQIIYDKSLNNFPCQKLVIQDALGSCSPLTQLILDIFEANDGTNLILKSSSTLSDVNAKTSSTSSYNSTTHTCDITITFRESYLQTATDLAIARTAIHESLHATLVYMYEENLLQSVHGTTMDGFEDFVEAYVNHLSDLTVNLNKAHHELMADFIKDIASSLSVYGASNGHSNSFDFYKKLSWSGDILKTPTYQSLYPEYLNPTDSTANPSNINPVHLDIVNTSAAEENDATYVYPHPNGITYTNSPKGTAPNASEPCN